MAGKNSEKELLQELGELRLKVAELEILKRQYRWTEERLRREKELAQNYLDVAGVIMVVLDSRGGVTLINKRGSEILGYTQNEILGKNWFDNFIPERIRDNSRVLFDRLMAGNLQDTEYYENPILTKRGQERLIHWHNALLRNDEGKVIATLSSGEDITEKKTAEEARIQSLEFYRSLIRTSPDAIFLADPEGNLIMVNQRAADLFKIDHKESAIGRSMFEFVDPRDKQLAAENFNKLGELGSILNNEYKLAKIDGSVFFGEVSTSVVRDAHGNIKAYMGIVRDITARRNAEEATRQALVRETTLEALKESRDYLEKIINAVADPIFVKDREHRWVLLNDAYCKFMGYSRQELIGKSDYDYFPKEEADVFWNRDEIVFETGNENVNEEEFTDAKGIKYTIVTKKTLYVDARGEKFIVGIIRDITERKRLEAETLERKRLETELAERAKAESALQESERQHSMVFDAMSDAIHVVDRDLRIVMANARFKQWTQELGIFSDITGKTPFEAFPFLPDRVRQEYEKVFNEASLLVSEEVNTVGARTIVTETRKIPIFKEAKVVQIVTVIRDVTERRNAELAIQESEEKYRTLVENLNVGVYRNTSGPQGKFIHANSALVKIHGYGSIEEFMKISVSDLYQNPEERQAFMEELIEKGLVKDKQLYLRKKDGTPIIVSCTAKVQYDSEGKVKWIDGVIEDITERKKSEEDLRLTQFSVDCAAEAIFWIGEDARFYYVNNHACDVLGYSRQELLSLSVHDIDPNYTKDVWPAHWEEIRQRGSFSFETSHKAKDGRIFPVEVTVNYLKFGDREYNCAFARDISERKKFQKDLLFTKAVVDHMGDATFWIDSAGKVFYANEAACRRLEYSPEELSGKTIHEIDVDFPKKDWVRRWQIMRAEKSAILESRYRTKSGKVFPVEISGTCIEHGDKEYLCAIVRDLTEREEAHRSLLASEHEKEVVLSSLSELVMYHDRDMKLRWVNKAASEFLGLPGAELIGKYCHEILHKIKVPYEECPVARVFKSGKTEEQEILLPSGRWWFVRAYPVKDEKNKVEGAVEVILDITRRKKAEEEQRDILEKSRRILDETVIALAATAERRDPYTAGHQRRVGQLAGAIARQIGLDEDQVEGIRMSAIIHDVGKVYVPVEILSKPSKLTELEFSIIQTHPHIGYEILKHVEFPWPVAKIVLQHHEKINGSGYPDGIRGEDILIEAKIITVADVVEAMASHRPYRPALGIDVALREISKNKGTLYDSQVVEACIRVFKKGHFSFDK
jgi:PAS domain S-box-containing protein/putative nucleotidyltransferase with HDIG domain